MKKIKILLVLFLGVIALAMVSSCNKDELKNTSDTPSAAIRTETPLPTVQNGILKFTSKSHLSAFIKETISLDDDERTVLESSLGFQSLYSYVKDAPTFPDNTIGKEVNGVKVYETSSPYQTVLNQYSELWVGNDIYKYVGENLVVKTTGTYVSEIIDIRNNNGIQRDHTTLIDFTKDSVIVLKPRTTCQMILSEPFKPTGNYGYLKMTFKDSDGNIFTGVPCGGPAGKLTIDWGDGSKLDGGPENTNLTDARSHRFPEPPLASCVTYTVKVKVEFSFASIGCVYQICGNGASPLVFESTMTITICNPNTCTPSEDDRAETLISTHVYNNGQNKAEFFLGYDLENTWFKEPKAWGRIKHYRLDGSQFKKSKPNFDLKMNIHGTAFEDNCDNGSARSVSRPDHKRANDFKFEVNLDDFSQSGSVSDYHLRTDDRLYIDWQVFHLNNTTAFPEVLDFPFY
jgi:hypothetical protein